MPGPALRPSSPPEARRGQAGLVRDQALAAIKSDRRAARLYQEAAQLKSHAREATAFFANAVAAAGKPTPALLSYVETLVSVVRLTDQYPGDAAFELETEEGKLLLGADGKPRPQAASEPVLESPASARPLLLDGLASTEPIALSAFMEAYSRKRINRSTFEAFLGAPDRVKEEWDLGRLRAFYATRGSPKWIPPVDDFVKIDRILDRQAGAAKTRAVILKAMADAGAMGFCPTQYLRRVIEPRLAREASDPAALERSACLLADCFKYICEEMGGAGDGSASNLFTLKTLIRPLAAPGSRLFDARAYDDPDSPRAEEIVFTIGKRWARLMADSGPFAREVLRGYADGFLEGLVRIETPKGILSGALRLLDHLQFLCSLVTTRARLAAFGKAAHVAGTAKLLGRAEGSAHYATFLNTLLAHFDAVEALAPDPRHRDEPEGDRTRGGAARPFGHEYRRYLSCFARGLFSSPEELRAYVESSGELARRASRDSDELLEAIMRYAREPEERALLLGFARECPVFDKAIYLRWRALGPEERKAATAFLDEAYRRYLIEPGYVPDGSAAGLGGVDIEPALVKAHANASALSKRQVEEVLASHSEEPLPPIPAAFARPFRFSISERGYLPAGPRARNRDPAFIRSRIALAQRVALDSSDPEARAAERGRLAESALSRLAGLEAAMAPRPSPAAGPEAEREARRLAGLREQAAGLAAFADYLRGLEAARLPSVSGNAAFEDAVEGGLYFLAGDKAFAKAEREALAAFALGRALSGAPERLSEEPWATVLACEPEADGYGADEIAALRELLSTGLAGAVDAYFHGPYAALPPASAAALRRLFAAREPRLAEGPVEAIADRASRLLSSCAGSGKLDAELSAMEGERASRKREILLVGAKRRLEHFFGYIGELCIARCTGEPFRKAFVPVRIVDLREMKVVGYVQLLLVGGARRAGGVAPASVLVVGVEPKTSWMLHFDEAELYRGVKAYLVRAAAEAGAESLLWTLQVVARSNCESVSRLIEADLGRWPVARSDRELRFPEGCWAVFPAARAWSRAGDAIPLDADRGLTI